MIKQLAFFSIALANVVLGDITYNFTHIYGAKCDVPKPLESQECLTGNVCCYPIYCTKTDTSVKIDTACGAPKRDSFEAVDPSMCGNFPNGSTLVPFASYPIQRKIGVYPTDKAFVSKTCVPSGNSTTNTTNLSTDGSTTPNTNQTRMNSNGFRTINEGIISTTSIIMFAMLMFII